MERRNIFDGRIFRRLCAFFDAARCWSRLMGPREGMAHTWSGIPLNLTLWDPIGFNGFIGSKMKGPDKLYRGLSEPHMYAAPKAPRAFASFSATLKFLTEL